MNPPAPVTSALRFVFVMRSSGEVVRLAVLRCSCRPEHGGNGSGDDLQVEPQRPLVDVLHVELYPSFEAQITATTDLPESRQPGPDAETAHQCRLAKATHVA